MRSTSFPDYQAVLHKRMPGRSHPSHSRTGDGPCDDHGPAKVLDRQFVCYKYSPFKGNRTCYYNTTGSYDDACEDFNTIMKEVKNTTVVRCFNGRTGISGKSVFVQEDFKVEVRNGSSEGDGRSSRPTLQINSPSGHTVEVRKFRYIQPSAGRGLRPRSGQRCSSHCW